MSPSTNRYAHGKTELYAEFAAELVRLQMDTMVVGSAAATLVAKRATQTIPIVMVGGGDPVRSGVVASLARPGGNITGVSMWIGEEVFGKWVELLKEVASRVSRVAYLRDPRNPVSAPFLKDAQHMTRALGVKLQVFEVHEPRELDSTLSAMSREPGGSFITVGEALFFAHLNQLTTLALKYKLPGIYGHRMFVEAGGLTSYGPSLPDLWRRAATYVDKVLKGARPGDLPVEQPTKFELVINLKTAKALGLTIPQSLLIRADEVIE
jgi:ABC-type uncharacterized transport system substrate-binding protein